MKSKIKKTIICETTISIEYSKDDYELIQDKIATVNVLLKSGYYVSEIRSGIQLLSIDLKNKTIQEVINE